MASKLRMIAVVLLFLGVFGAVIADRENKRIARIREGGHQTIAKVLSTRESSSRRRRRNHYLEIEYRVKDGTLHKQEIQVPSGVFARAETKRSIEIYYDPVDPNQIIRADHTVGKDTKYKALAGFAGAALLIFVASFWLKTE